MRKYIDAEALKTALVDKFKSRIGAAYVPSWNDAMNVVNSIPAADVVEVVRCRDCVFGNMPCAMARYPDYFCADGKPKDGGKDDASNT